MTNSRELPTSRRLRPRHSLDTAENAWSGHCPECEVIRWADTTPTGWRNGGGFTRELICVPQGEHFDWRISIADVASSGQFSTFDGVDRVIVLVDGPRMILTAAGVSNELQVFVPFRFDGGQVVSCAVPSGPTRDLNIMTRRHRCTARVDIVSVRRSVSFRTGDPGVEVFVPLGGPLTASGTCIPRTVLERFDALRVVGAFSLALDGTGHVARVRIEHSMDWANRS